MLSGASFVDGSTVIERSARAEVPSIAILPFAFSERLVTFEVVILAVPPISPLAVRLIVDAVRSPFETSSIDPLVEVIEMVPVVVKSSTVTSPSALSVISWSPALIASLLPIVILPVPSAPAVGVAPGSFAVRLIAPLFVRILAFTVISSPAWRVMPPPGVVLPEPSIFSETVISSWA